MNDTTPAAMGSPLAPEPYAARARAWVRGFAFRFSHGLRGHRVYCWHHRTKHGGGWLEVCLQCVSCDAMVYVRDDGPA